MAQDLYPSSKRSRVANASCAKLINLQIQEILLDFCFPSFILHPGFDTNVTFAILCFAIWTVLGRTYETDTRARTGSRMKSTQPKANVAQGTGRQNNEVYNDIIKLRKL